MQTPDFKSLISPPWAKPAENSYYGDPANLEQEQQGLKHINQDESDEESVERVVILGYN